MSFNLLSLSLLHGLYLHNCEAGSTCFRKDMMKREALAYNFTSRQLARYWVVLCEGQLAGEQDNSYPPSKR